ncbi:hypothetical protein [Piscinibacter sakaiensis]|nr:hypothetical protein [Piscinibacter sakaiensis]
MTATPALERRRAAAADARFDTPPTAAEAQAAVARHQLAEMQALRDAIDGCSPWAATSAAARRWRRTGTTVA